MIGPMVIAGIVIDSKDEKKLKALGVRDSKKLSPLQREALAPHIEKIARNTIILRVPACKIDRYRAMKINLDKIEAMKMAEIIDMSNADRVYVDSLEFRPERFKQLIVRHLSNKKIDLIVENYADETYPVVSAASIIAKVYRDEAIKEIERKAGQPIGIGYPHDSLSVKFVEKLIKERKKLPTYVRKSWTTTQLLQEKTWQRKLKDFIKKIKV